MNRLIAQARIPTRFLLCLAMLSALGLPAPAQDEPYIVHDTKPVIMHGPYITSLTETSATIVWITDTPCHARVSFWTEAGPRREADSAEHGFLPVGMRHVVHLTGLEPGRSYSYQAVATRVVKMKAYWPEKGLASESPERTFTTFDRAKPAAAFVAIADTHEDIGRIRDLFKAVDWPSADFLVHLGDAFHSLESEDQLFERWLGPASRALGGSKLHLFVRGNHEARGGFARGLFDLIPTPEGRYYYVRDAGPIHLVVLDTGEDKADAANVYAGLNAFEAYRGDQLAWLERHFATDRRAAEAPFRVVLMHQPEWGFDDAQKASWVAFANEAKIDLVIGGHYHTLQAVPQGTDGHGFATLVLNQDQIARVEASRQEIRVTVIGKDGLTLAELAVKARR